MSKESRNLSVGPLHARETLFSSGTLGALNAEIIIPSDGCASVSVDLRGTFSLTAEVSGTVDGTNWTPIPMRPVNQAAKRYVAAITGTAAGVWIGSCSPYKSVRVRDSAHTSGSAAVAILACNAPLDQSMDAMVTTDILNVTAAASAAATLTLAAPGAGLRHYITYLSISRFATTLLTAGATPVLVTSTNIPGTPTFNFPADAAAQGTLDRWREDFAFPITAAAQNTATTFVAPATTGVIWRITAGWYVAP